MNYQRSCSDQHGTAAADLAYQTRKQTTLQKYLLQKEPNALLTVEARTKVFLLEIQSGLQVLLSQD